MDYQHYQTLIETTLSEAKATVSGAGNKIEVSVTSPDFAGLSPVKRHQLVYKIFSQQLSSGELHAISIKAFTPDELS